MSSELTSISGKGLLALWSDLDLGREDEFDTWHVHEHLPERVLVPGFLRARRYVRVPPSPAKGAILTLYETDNVEVMASAPYIERLDNPTPLTRQTVPLMENMRRSALRRWASLGQGVGGHLSVWQFQPSSESTETARRQLTDTVLFQALTPVGVIACHLFEPEVESTRAKDATAEGKATRTAEEAPRWLLMIEAIHARGLAEAQLAIVNEMARVSNESEVTIESYRLAVVLDGPMK